MLNKRRALVALGAGTLLFALAPSVLKLLMNSGGTLGLHRPNAISLCNVLFVGNFCAGLVTLSYRGPGRIWRELKSLSARTWGLLVLGALVYAIYPALLFTGLERTTVMNVVLLSRFNGIVLVVLAWLFLEAGVRLSEAVGYAVVAVGVVALVIMNNRGFRISSGELFVLGSTLFFALTGVVNKFALRESSVHTYVFFRNVVSSIVFFTTGLYLFGADHFADAFTGELWVLMLVYAGLAVVAAQVFWLTGARSLPAQSAANFDLITPAFSIVFAWVLLSEIPGRTEWIAMAIIGAGILIPVLAGRKTGETPLLENHSPEMGLAGR